MLNQNTVQNSKELMFGSATLYISTGAPGSTETGSSATNNLGAMNSIAFKETIEYINSSADNANLGEYVKKQTCTVTGELLEFSLAKMNMLRGAIDTYTQVAGTESTATDEVVVFSAGAGKMQRLAHKHAPLGVPTLCVPTTVDNQAAPGGTTYTLEAGADNDYTMYLDDEGYTCIIREETGAIGATGTVYVTYTYTPEASRVLSSGGKTAIAPRTIKLVNKNASNETVTIVVYKASFKDGLDMSYQPDEADRPNGFKVTFEGICDSTRTVGDQLYKIEDTRALA